MYFFFSFTIRAIAGQGPTLERQQQQKIEINPTPLRHGGYREWLKWFEAFYAACAAGVRFFFRFLNYAPNGAHCVRESAGFLSSVSQKPTGTPQYGSCLRKKVLGRPACGFLLMRP